MCHRHDAGADDGRGGGDDGSLQARYVSTLFKKKKVNEECLPETHADLGLVSSSSPNPTTNSN